MKMEEYLRTVTEQIRCKKARELVSGELKDHILEQADAYEADGMFEEEALEKAVREMGDPVETGVSLDRVHRPQMSWSTLALIGVISILSILLHAAFGSCSESLRASGAGIGYLKNHIMYTVYGYILMILVYRMDYSILSRFPKTAAAGFLAFLLIGRSFLGIEYGGMIFYMQLGPFALSIPILMYLYAPFFAGILYHYRGEGYGVFLKLLPWIFIPLLITLHLPYLGGVLALAMVFAILISVAVWQRWYRVNKRNVLAVLWTAVLAGPVLFTGLSYITGKMPGYQMARVHALFLWDRSLNYASSLAGRLISSASLLGQSELGAQELGNLPGFNSDFVFAGLISVYGILAGILAAALLAFLLIKIFRISFRQRNQLGMMLGCACGAIFLVQTVICLAMNLGLIPVMGSVLLPFFSSGGSGILVSYILLGLVLSVYRYKNILAEKPRKKKAGIAS